MNHFNTSVVPLSNGSIYYLQWLINFMIPPTKLFSFKTFYINCGYSLAIIECSVNVQPQILFKQFRPTRHMWPLNASIWHNLSHSCIQFKWSQRHRGTINGKMVGFLLLKWLLAEKSTQHAARSTQLASIGSPGSPLVGIYASCN